MLLTRRIGKLVRGKATPFQIYAACLLGAFLGFAPGFQQAPGLILFWSLLLLVLNANLFLAGVVGLVSKLLYWVALPLAFHFGVLLLEGPTRGLFAAMANAPVLAYFGLEYYAVVGGQALGLLVGLAAGYGTARALAAYRRKMAALERDSERLKKWGSKKWVAALAFVFLGGGRGKASYEELLSRRVGNPFRAAGLAAALVLALLAYLGLRFLEGPFLAAAIRSGLERANGATVELEDARLSLDEGKLELAGLAMADPENLSSNLFEAGRIDADISAADLLRKRFSIDRLAVENGAIGRERAVPGERIGKPPKPSAAPGLELPDYKDLGEALKNAPEWKRRLAQMKRWLQAATPAKADKASWKRQLEARIRSAGYANVQAKDLIRNSPTFWIRDLTALGVDTAQWPGGALDIQGRHLSTHPALVPEPASLEIRSSDERLDLSLVAGASAGAEDNRLDLHLRDLEVDRVASQLKGEAPPLEGGRMDLALEGALDPLDADLTLGVALSDTVLRIGGSEAPIDRLRLPIQIKGPIDNPSFKLEAKALQKALAAAGKQELMRKASEKLDVDLPGGGSIQDAAKGALGGFLKKRAEQGEADEEGE